MILQESGENYLETILMLQQQNGSVRSIDIATHMNFTKASVSRAMSILKRENYILMEADGNIILTETGLAKANAVLERHLLLTRLFTRKSWRIRKKQLEKDACRIEHVITTPKPLPGIKKLIQKLLTIQRSCFNNDRKNYFFCLLLPLQCWHCRWPLMQNKTKWTNPNYVF